MVNNLQNFQIGKVSDGNSFLPSDVDAFSTGASEIPGGGFSPQRLASRGLRSPQTVVPFDDFFAMFTSHIAAAESRAENVSKLVQGILTLTRTLPLPLPTYSVE